MILIVHVHDTIITRLDSEDITQKTKIIVTTNNTYHHIFNSELEKKFEDLLGVVARRLD